MRPLLIIISIIVVVVVVACASAPPPRPVAAPAPVPTSTSPEEMNAQVMKDAKKTAAEQLACPIEQVDTRCTRRDAHGGCIAIEARGCDKTLEYEFGTE